MNDIALLLFGSNWFKRQTRRPSTSVPSCLLHPRQPHIADVIGRYDSARMSVIVTSRVMQQLHCQGMSISQSGRLLSDLSKPAGYFCEGMLAYFYQHSLCRDTDVVHTAWHSLRPSHPHHSDASHMWKLEQQM